jgi:hypothetical protein
MRVIRPSPVDSQRMVFWPFGLAIDGAAAMKTGKYTVAPLVPATPDGEVLGWIAAA